MNGRHIKEPILPVWQQWVMAISLGVIVGILYTVSIMALPASANTNWLGTTADRVTFDTFGIPRR